MTTIDRRALARAILGGACAAAGLALIPGPVNAMPIDARLAGAADDWIEKAQAVVVGPVRPRPRRRRVWRCWWHRGRRICGWR